MRVVRKTIVSSGASMMLAVVLLQPSACSDASDPGGDDGSSGKSGGAQSTGGSLAGGGTSAVPKAGAAAGGSNTGSAGGSGGATSGVSGDGSGGAKGGAAGNGGAGRGGAGGGGTGGSGGGSATDPFEILRKLRPSGSAGNDYDIWMDGEIGTPVVASTAVADGNIKAPILVPAGVVYDGKGQTIKPSISGCSGSQTESQPPVFILVPGAGLKNVTISPPACDGVHMMGNNTLENVVWTDVGEDAASVRSYFPGGKISIKGGSLKSADDKAFQFNAPVQVTVSDLVASNISKLVRQNGGADFPMTVHLSNVKVSDCGEAVVRGGPNCKLTSDKVTADCPLWEDD
jgi:hypothetical protein